MSKLKIDLYLKCKKFRLTKYIIELLPETQILSITNKTFHQHTINIILLFFESSSPLIRNDNHQKPKSIPNVLIYPHPL